MSTLPASAHPHLELQLDWGHGGEDRDLNEIAYQMVEWEEKLSAPLGLTRVNIHDITELSHILVLQR